LLPPKAARVFRGAIASLDGGAGTAGAACDMAGVSPDQTRSSLPIPMVLEGQGSEYS
jgi:hypothetical protein